MVTIVTIVTGFLPLKVPAASEILSKCAVGGGVRVKKRGGRGLGLKNAEN